MAVESAILGTPSIYISTLAGTMGNFSELEKKYGLLFNYIDSQSALTKITELFKDSELKKSWGLKRAALLRDKINVTEFMTFLILSGNSFASRDLIVFTLRSLQVLRI